MEHFGLWGIIPPLLAIILALITKDVIFSLFTGILSGALIVSGGNPFYALVILTDKLADMVSDSWNIRILLFCALMGAFVGMFSQTGATRAFGQWASKFLKTKRSVMLFTWFFGLLIFIDDYFNSLSVGTVMRPATDEKGISRAKLAYILDSTAAPVCIIAPISTWVVTVMSYIRDSHGFSNLGVGEFMFFLKVIPYNIYAVLALLLVFLFTMGLKDFGPMAKSEKRASKGTLFSEDIYGACPGNIESVTNSNARWYDMVISILILIVVCISFFPITTWLSAMDDGMGFFQAANTISVREAFVDTDASKALFYGAIVSLFISYLYYLGRKLLTIKTAGSAIIDGIKSMVPALVVLSLAWTIGNIIRSTPEDNGLGLAMFLSESVAGGSFPLWLLPAIMYLLSCLISFSTGTSWGTFGIMIPISIPIATSLAAAHGYQDIQVLNILCITIGSVMSGAIFGDHCSPISDTTILSSTGSNCPLLEHVATQIPYSVTVALASLVGIIVAGLTLNVLLSMAASLMTLSGLLFVMPRIVSKLQKSAT